MHNDEKWWEIPLLTASVMVLGAAAIGAVVIFFAVLEAVIGAVFS